MSFISFLKSVGNGFKKGLPIVIKAAQVADIGISIANPALGGIINTSIATVLSVEQKFTAMGQQSGTGPQKLAEAVGILFPAFEQVFAQHGVKIDSSHVENYINAIVAALNAFPPLPTPTLPLGIIAQTLGAQTPVKVAQAGTPAPAQTPVAQAKPTVVNVELPAAGADPILSNAG